MMGQIAHEVGMVAEKHGLTHQQLLLLRGLEPPRPMGEVADAMCCDPSNVTTMIDRLQGRGLVERTPGSEDRRVKMLSLTSEGRVLLRKVDQELERRLLPEDAGPRAIDIIRRMRRLLGGSAAEEERGRPRGG
jgi:DNA-binding MarR family transcriptional regulator